MDDAKELVDRLCTLAGMILEDASAQAISIGERDQLRSKLRTIRSAAADAVILADAAVVVLERSRAGRR